MEDSADLIGFYERAYSLQGPKADKAAQWRSLGALGKADHVTSLCGRAGVRPASTLDVGCGDGALLGELARRGFGGRLAGIEISEPAAAIARAGLADAAEIGLFDGARLPFADGEFELGILSHVLEHVPDPPALLREAARVCRAVVFEVPLEANWSARRPAKRAHAEEIGHLQRLGREDARAIAADAGLQIAAELLDPLPRSVHVFFATGARGRAAGTAKWALRAGAERLAAPLARRLFTLHYAALCRPPAA
ncbi:MAG TPA: class I SAM-dependent methyltransferase [Solirubrobacteraceae bacterium]|nr:class I SAM-dependent methyltransferase [Solirubrobacteraceae bacterium]